MFRQAASYTVLLWFAWAAAAQSVSNPMVFYPISLQPGLQAVGVSMVNSSVFTGTVLSNSSNSITISQPSGSVNIGGLLTSATAYYAELINGPNSGEDPYVGERFEVNVPSTIDSANSVVTIDTASNTNTISGSLPTLTGYQLTIRPHITLNQIFPKTMMQGSSTVAQADQVYLLNASGGYDIYYLLSNGGSLIQWTKAGDNTLASQDNLVLAPGVGMLVKRVGTTPNPLTLAITGLVRINAFVQPLKQGLNLVSEGYPLNDSPITRNTFATNGFTGSVNLAASDQVFVYNGSSYDTYYYLYNGANLNQWTKVGDKTFSSQNNTTFYEYGGSVFIEKVSADPDYVMPLPFTP